MPTVTKHKHEIAAFVRGILGKAPIILDAETTGIENSAEVVEIAVLDDDGTLLLETLIHPTVSIPLEVQQIHGITNHMVADAPSLQDIWPQLDALLQRRVVVIYNSAFVLRLLAQSARKQGIFARQPLYVYCAMLIYAEFHGKWNNYYKAYSWQRLHEAVKQCRLRLAPDLLLHRAAADCEATRQVMFYMANWHGRTKTKKTRIQ